MLDYLLQLNIYNRADNAVSLNLTICPCSQNWSGVKNGLGQHHRREADTVFSPHREHSPILDVHTEDGWEEPQSKRGHHGVRLSMALPPLDEKYLHNLGTSLDLRVHCM